MWDTLISFADGIHCVRFQGSHRQTSLEKQMKQFIYSIPFIPNEIKWPCGQDLGWKEQFIENF